MTHQRYTTNENQGIYSLADNFIERYLARALLFIPKYACHECSKLLIYLREIIDRIECKKALISN
jgi:hypothetical protein